MQRFRRHQSGPLRLEIRQADDTAWLVLAGEFDIASFDAADRALQALLDRDVQHVVLDLSGLEFMDSTGVRFLVGARESAIARGVTLSLVPGGEAVRRILTVSGLATLFDSDTG